MTRESVRALRIAGLVLALGTSGVATLVGQDAREPIVSRAFREFDPARRQQLLMNALNPTSGPLRGAWPLGVQLLAQTLIEDRKDSAAAVWLRWAIRLSPDLQPDTVMFLPEVVAAYRSARTFVARTADPADSLVVTTWVWPASAVREPEGRFEIVASAPGSVPVEIAGVGRIAPGGTTSLNPGSYELRAATGSSRVLVTREVLPGVTTVVRIQLPPSGPEVVSKPAAPMPQQVATQSASPRKKKGFPMVWAGVGAAGAVGLVVLLAKGGSAPPAETGGIIVTFPSP